VLRRIVLAALVGLGLAAPVATWARSGGEHGMGPRVFGMQEQARGRLRHQPGFAGLGASGAYSTLLSGTFVSPEPEAGLVVPPPFYPYYYAAPAYAPPPRCVRPLLIHLVPSHPAKNLPRLVYGTSFDCAG
jgi:hypothetical protein